MITRRRSGIAGLGTVANRELQVLDGLSQIRECGEWSCSKKGKKSFPSRLGKKWWRDRSMLFFGSVVHLYVTNTPTSACSCFRCWAFSFVEAPLAFQVATESHVSGQKYAASGCFSVAVDFELTLTCLLTCLRRLVLEHSGQQNASQYCQWRRKKVSRYPVRSLGHPNSTSFIHSVFLLPCPGPIFTPPPSLRLVILRSR